MNARPIAWASILLLVLAVWAAPAMSLARFTAAKASTGSFATGSLAPPTSLSGTGGTSTRLAWTATTSGSATGYQVMRSATSGSGYAQVKTVTPISATSTTDAPGNGTWYYVMRSYLQSWTSGYSNEAWVVIGPTSTGLRNCANNAPETPGAGDNNGYETNPGNACASDGAMAVDANSGSSLSNSCSDPGKDRHWFWGYAFGMPGSVSSIDGITVQAIAGTNNTSGTYGICVQLSSDGGATWTTAKIATLSTGAITTYTFGGTADTWGRSWSLANLSSPGFRVRISDVATVANKTFSLDYVGVSIRYTP